MNYLGDMITEYSKALAELGKENNNIIVLNSDLTKSTGTNIFKESFPDRYINVGIAEQNQVGIAAGLSTLGFIPIVHTFAVFALLRACEQIRTSICYTNLNVKIIGAKGGISDSANGATHHSIEDLSIARAIPNLVVINPIDGIQVKQAIRAAIEYVGPVYIRINSVKLPNITKKQFKIGQIEKLKDGSGDIVIFGSGDTIYQCVLAGDKLTSYGINVDIISVPTLKPIDCPSVIEACRNAKYVLTVETNCINGGLGGCISEIISQAGLTAKVIRMGIKNQFTESGKYNDLLNKYKISCDCLVDTVKTLV